ncbi:helix-turn-helix domain-containing protein [Arachidicoccus soli]
MIESGKVNPSLQTLEKIMAVLGLELTPIRNNLH